jgi:catechol 2,3-dioxygenase-like lactoylglutathione lyase family enzyme
VAYIAADGGIVKRNTVMASALRSVAAVRIFVDDLDRARSFYRDTLELDERAVDPEWLVFDLDGKDIVVERVAPDDPEHDPLVGRFLAVTFTVDDVHAAHRELTAKGVAFDHPPEKQFWGGTLAYARDPDGNVFALVSY